MTPFDKTTDLVIERIIDAPRHLLWRCWTEAEHLKQWWCPRPWTTPEAEIELVPGGRFFTVMRGPAGEGSSGVEGCFLEIVPGERLVWTLALRRGFRPVLLSSEIPVFTAIISFDDAGEGRTAYRALAMHRTAAERDLHDEMGFHDGWGETTTQLEEHARALLAGAH